MQHLEEGIIHAWLDGALSGDEAERVETHVRQCAECAAAVGEARGLIAGASRIVSALDTVPGGVIPRSKPAAARAPKSTWSALRFTPLRAAIAASVLVGVASMFTLPFTLRQDAKEGAPSLVVLDTAVPERAAAPAVSSPPAAPTPVTVPTSAPPQAQTAAGGSANVAKMADQRKPELTTTGVPVAEKVVADAAPIAPPNAAPPAVADSPRTTDARVTSAAGLSAEISRRDAARSAPVRLFSQTEPPRTLAGCFRVAEDPSRLGIALPVRFSLDRDSSRNVLRKLDDSGRAESVVGEWRQVSATSVSITLDNREQRGNVSLTQDRSGALTVQSSALGVAAPAVPGVASRSVSVSRMDCGR